MEHIDLSKTGVYYEHMGEGPPCLFARAYKGLICLRTSGAWLACQVQALGGLARRMHPAMLRVARVTGIRSIAEAFFSPRPTQLFCFCVGPTFQPKFVPKHMCSTGTILVTCPKEIMFYIITTHNLF